MRTCLILHSWWGLSADTRAVADRLRGEGYVVATPDLYGGGQIATTIEDAKALLAARDLAAARARVDAAVQELAGVGPLAVVGWSMGAAFGWDLVARQPGVVRALVVYYGLGDPAELTAAPPILAHVAGLDASPSTDEARAVELSMAAMGRTFELHVYPATRHWFDEPSRPEYDERASALAWRRTLAFLASST